MPLYQTLANCHSTLKRGQVWCYECGATRRVDVAGCFASGWPKCCGFTMSIDSPAERGALKAKAVTEQKR